MLSLEIRPYNLIFGWWMLNYAQLFTMCLKDQVFGLHGLRELVETPTRPMIQAVVKPMGTPNEELARMCGAYTRGGADVIRMTMVSLTSRSLNLKIG